ncbi:hypothetical protein TcCL_ESM09589 [Trypanosoma cruzi]|nr:hypothetical protein TcCL_ESM09589 [Trypanosoma cruzi]
MSNADGVTRSHALWKAKFPGELEPPGIPPEPPPATRARARARDGTLIAPPPQTARPRPKALSSSFRTASYDQRAGLRLHLRHFHNQGRPRQLGSIPRNMNI